VPVPPVTQKDLYALGVVALAIKEGALRVGIAGLQRYKRVQIPALHRERQADYCDQPHRSQRPDRRKERQVANLAGVHDGTCGGGGSVACVRCCETPGQKAEMRPVALAAVEFAPVELRMAE
jgi:hypothetical protein